MKNIFKSFKEMPIKRLLLISIFILGIVSIIVFGPVLYKSYQDSKKKAIAEKQQVDAKAKITELESKISVVKKWPVETQESIGAKEIRLETKWQSGYLLYKFEVDLTEGTNHIRRSRDSYNGFFIEFLDSDGFKVFSFRIPLSSMTSIIDTNRTIIGLSINEKESISAEEYLKLETSSIGWNF